MRDAWHYRTPRWVLAQTRQEACDRLETTVMRPSGTRENKQTNLSLSDMHKVPHKKVYKLLKQD
jgi:hypothetical protein